jgi:hypothetical protein
MVEHRPGSSTSDPDEIAGLQAQADSGDCDAAGRLGELLAWRGDREDALRVWVQAYGDRWSTNAATWTARCERGSSPTRCTATRGAATRSTCPRCRLRNAWTATILRSGASLRRRSWPGCWPSEMANRGGLCRNASRRAVLEERFLRCDRCRLVPNDLRGGQGLETVPIRGAGRPSLTVTPALEP